MRTRKLDETSAPMIVARIAAIVIIAVVTGAAFALSYTSLAALAIAADIPHRWAGLLPVVIDGTILLGTLGWLALANRPERQYFRSVLTAGALVSVSCNALHAVELGHGLPWPVRAAVAAVAPVSLLVDTHGLALLIRTSMPAVPVAQRAPRKGAVGKRQRAVALRAANTSFADIGRTLGVSPTTARTYVQAGRTAVAA